MILLGCGNGASGGFETGAIIRLDPHRLCVPDFHASRERSFNRFSSVPGLDNSPEGKEALIVFSRLNYKSVASGYVPEKNRLDKIMIEDTVWMASLNDIEYERYKYHGLGEKNVEDLWFGEGDWTKRTLEPFGHDGWYRAFRFPEGNSWQVLRRYPDRTSKLHEAPDFWIASCHINSFGRRTCTASVILEELRLVVQLDLEEKNLPYREQIASYIEEQLKSWRITD